MENSIRVSRVATTFVKKILQGPELDLMSESFSDEFGNPDGYSHKLIYLQWNFHKLNFGTPLQWS